MLTLKTFGGVSLSHGEAVLDGPAAQRRRLALLAVIACAGPHGVSRDKLVGLFWPESDAARARHALSQWIFLLRRDLPAADVIAGAAELRVDRGHLRCDAVDFDEAISRRDYARALDVYTGAFLDGFFLSEAPEFERWAEDERARRHADASRAAEELARSAEARGDGADAVRWWRRLSGLEPLSGRVATELMRALAHVGERALAIAHAREHARLVERALGHPPGPEVADLARHLSESATAPAPRADVAPRVSRRESSYVTWLRERLMPRVRLDRVIRDTPIMTLFAATDPETGRALVVRMLASAIVARADMRRLIDRLYIATRLAHPRLVPLGQLYRDEELVYLAGPPASGESLRARLERERHLSLAETLTIARDVASALTAAEDSGVPLSI
jgi:serine/threonine-protein kinase